MPGSPLPPEPEMGRSFGFWMETSPKAQFSISVLIQPKTKSTRRAELAESLKNLLQKRLNCYLSEASTQTSFSDGDQLFLLPCEEEEEKPWCFSEIEIFPLVLSRIQLGQHCQACSCQGGGPVFIDG